MVVCLMGTRRHWVVVGSFIPRPNSRTLTSLLFGLNYYTNSDSRFSIILSPGEPLITDDRLLHQKNPKILSDVLLRLYVVALAIPLHR